MKNILKGFIHLCKDNIPTKNVSSFLTIVSVLILREIFSG